jgi:F-type H+-transporting ATPase subunit a
MTFLIPPLQDLVLLTLAAAGPMAHVEDGQLIFDIPFNEHGHGLLWRLGLTKQTFMFMLGGVLTLLFFWGYSRSAGKQAVPSRWGNLVESVLEFVRDQMTRPFMGKHGDKYVPLITAFFVYILITNLLGLVPFFDWLGHGSNTGTGQLAITGGLAICSFFIDHGFGIKEQGGLWTYIKNLFPHVPIPVYAIMIPVELIAHIVRPCALALRLFANMLAGHIMVAVILGFTAVFTSEFIVGGFAIAMTSFLVVTALTFLELLVAVIQAFVFAFLTTVFLAGAIHPEH